MVLNVVFVFVALIMLAIVAAVAWAAYRSSRDVQTQLTRAWQGVADQLGGRLTPAALARPMRIEAELDGVPVVVDHFTGAGKSNQKYTRVVARLDRPMFRLELLQEHAFSGLTKALGAQDIEVGSRGIDERYIIKTSDEDLCKACFQTDLVEAIGRAPQSYSFSIDRDRVEATGLFVEENPGILLSVVQTAVALAKSSHPLRERWNALAGELEGTPGGGDVGDLSTPATLTFRVEGTEVVVDTLRLDVGSGDTRTWMRVRLHRRAERTTTFAVTRKEVRKAVMRLASDVTGEGAASVELADVCREEENAAAWEAAGHYAARSNAPDEMRSAWRPEHVERLWALGADALFDDGKKVMVLIPGVVFDVETLKGAGALVASVAAEAERGAYR